MQASTAAKNEQLVTFCAARERLKRFEAETKEERAEQNDAHRTLGGLLSESMTRHNVTCVALEPSAEDPTLRYAHLVRGSKRMRPLKTKEDVMALVGDLSRHVASVPREDLPNAVATLVATRARANSLPPLPPRVRVSTRPPTASSKQPVVQASLAPAETRALTEQFDAAVRERTRTTQTLRPLRAAVREAQSTLLSLLTPDATPERIEALPLPSQDLEKEDETTPRKKRKVLEVQCVTTQPRRRSSYGIRDVCAKVKAVVARFEGERDALDAFVLAELPRVLDEEREKETMGKTLKVRAKHDL